jgi:hypothetical protein
VYEVVDVAGDDGQHVHLRVALVALRCGLEVEQVEDVQCRLHGLVFVELKARSFSARTTFRHTRFARAS